MDSLSPVARVLRAFFMFVVLGFLTVVLIGPVLVLVTAVVSLSITLTSAFLPFAIIGLLVWVPYHLFTHGGEATWQKTRAMFQTTLAVPLRVCGGTWTRFCGVSQSVRNFNRQVLRFLGLFLLEAASGALVGILVAFLAAPDFRMRVGLTFACAGIGAGIGALVAIARFRLATAEDDLTAAAQSQSPES